VWRSSKKSREGSAIRINFGKYSGQEISEIPREYLEWLRKANDEINALINTELERRDALESDQQTMIEKIVHAGYRSMAQKLHPDTGGTTQDFQDLSAGYSQLQIILAELKGITRG
jgi:hypothetical protein